MKLFKRFIFYIISLEFLLPKETINLQKINIIGEQFNQLMESKSLTKGNLLFLKYELENIKTEEHTEKIEFYLFMINSLIGKIQ